MTETNGKVVISWRWLGPTVLVILVGAIGGWAASMQQRDRQLEEGLSSMSRRISSIEINVASVSSRLSILENQVGRIEHKVDQILAGPRR